MFDKVSRAAERAAAGVSRRDFVGQFGRMAAVLAAGVGGVLLTAGEADASGGKCCYDGYHCLKGACGSKPGVTVFCRECATGG